MLSHRRSSSVLAALVLAIVLAVAAAPAHAAPVLGVNLSGIPTDAQVSEAIASGAKDVRFFALWRDLEPNGKDGYDGYALGVYSSIVQRLAAAGVHTTLVVTQSPQWASGSTNPNTPPRDINDYAGFIGKFAAQPSMRGHGIGYEIWNEPDAKEFWGPAPDAAKYTALFKAAAAAVHTADPSAMVAVGPTTGNDYAWLEQLYGAGIGGTFDAVSVHTDTGCLDRAPSDVYREDGRIGRYSFLGYREVRKTMLAHGDDKPIWMSEFGWSSTQSDTAHPMCERGASAGVKPSGVTEENQAQFLTQAYHCASEDPYVALMGWFTARDASERESGNFDELEHYGLLREGGAARKPSWAAFNQIATAGDPLSSPCGDFAGPSIKILTPKLGESYSGHLLIQAQANDPGGIGRISFYADGKLIRNFTAGNDEKVSIDWAGAQDLAVGPHQISVAALDPQGNQEVAAVDVRKVSANSLLAVGPATFGGAFAKAVAKGGSGTRCRGRVCTVKGAIKSPAGAALPGKIEVRWQLGTKAKSGKLRYKTLHKKRRNANRPFTFTQRLRKGGQWRVGIAYLPPKPLKRAASAYGYFRVK